MHCELTVPAFARDGVSVVPGVLVFILTSVSTGSVDHCCARATFANPTNRRANRRRMRLMRAPDRSPDSPVHGSRSPFGVGNRSLWWLKSRYRYRTEDVRNWDRKSQAESRPGGVGLSF